MNKTNSATTIITAIVIVIIMLCTSIIAIKTIKTQPVTVDYSIKIDSLNNELLQYKDSIILYKDTVNYFNNKNLILASKLDSTKFVADSLAADNFRYQYKLGRIQSYINIVNRNSTQSKYLKGWITRVLNE